MKWIVRGLYNRTVFPKTAPGDTVEIPASKMADTVATALRIYGTTGYEPGDPLEESWVEIIDPREILSCMDHGPYLEELQRACRTCLEFLCEFYWAKYNRDDRPNGKTERSLSMGDLIQIAVTETEIHTFACRAEGWEEINYERSR